NALHDQIKKLDREQTYKLLPRAVAAPPESFCVERLAHAIQADPYRYLPPRTAEFLERLRDGQTDDQIAAAMGFANRGIVARSRFRIRDRVRELAHEVPAGRQEN